MFRKNEFVSLFLGSFSYLPAPLNLSFWWNFSSLIGVVLIVQFLSGLFLTMHYVSDVSLAFESVVHIEKDVNYGWFLRSMHANSASLFMFCILLHISRGLYYKSFMNFYTWVVGVVLLVLSMLTAFFGYVLPWGQMSFWSATVITNFLSVIPFYGVDVVNWIWSGYAVGAPTLTRFYTFHFLFPFLIIVFSLVHLVFLHRTGSSNPLKVSSGSLKMSFWPYSSVKDVLGFFVVFFMFMMIVYFYPVVFSDPENYIKANPLVTPVHIKPEWYFLFAYAILRCIPNKTLGVVALVLSVLCLIFLPFLNKFFCLSYSKISGIWFYVFFWLFSVNFLLLTWLSGSPVEEPYIFLARVCSILYFVSLFFIGVL